MTTGSESVSDRRAGGRINPAVVVVGVAVGVVYLGMGIAQGEVVAGLVGFGVMLLVVVGLVIGSRYSDTVALVGDDVKEERHVHIHRRAALIMVNVMAFVIVGAMVVDLAAGGDGTPYAWLAAVLGLGYITTVLVLNRSN